MPRVSVGRRLAQAIKASPWRQRIPLQVRQAVRRNLRRAAGKSTVVMTSPNQPFAAVVVHKSTRNTPRGKAANPFRWQASIFEKGGAGSGVKYFPTGHSEFQSKRHAIASMTGKRVPSRALTGVLPRMRMGDPSWRVRSRVKFGVGAGGTAAVAAKRKRKGVRSGGRTQLKRKR